MTAPIPVELTTGQLLAQRIALIGRQLESGAVPPTIGRRLAMAVGDVERRMARQAALRCAVAAINPAGTLSRWQTAQRLESALKRFETCGYRRVRDGGRRASALDLAFCTLLESGATCAQRLWEQIRDLDG